MIYSLTSSVGTEDLEGLVVIVCGWETNSASGWLLADGGGWPDMNDGG